MLESLKAPVPGVDYTYYIPNYILVDRARHILAVYVEKINSSPFHPAIRVEGLLMSPHLFTATYTDLPLHIRLDIEHRAHSVTHDVAFPGALEAIYPLFRKEFDYSYRRADDFIVPEEKLLTEEMFFTLMSMVQRNYEPFFEESRMKKQPKLPKTPDYEPYLDGSVVFLILGRGEIDGRVGPGKILRRYDKPAPSGDYRYEVEFLNRGVDLYEHSDLIPTKDFFDYMLTGKDCYVATVSAGNLFEINTPFLLRNGYLYNKNLSVILKYSKFQDKFKKNDILSESSNPAKKT